MSLIALAYYQLAIICTPCHALPVYHNQGPAVTVIQKVKYKGKGRRTGNIKYIFEEKLQGSYYRV
jgi:hypothetical protein